jgi:hypothetical protein
MSRERAFRFFSAFAGAIMLVWAAGYWYLNYKTVTASLTCRRV